jgi:hypothetical protein
MEHPPYSHDMSHDRDLFAKMKEPLRWTDTVQYKTGDYSCCRAVTEVDALMAYDAFTQIWQKVTHMEGGYPGGL